MVCSPRLNVAASISAGALTIGTVYLHRYAFICPDPTPLRRSAKKRGANTLIPYIPGLTPKPRRNTETEVSLNLWVDGWFPHNYNPPTVPANSNARQGALATFEWLHDALVEDPGGDSTRGASLTTPGGATLSGAVQVMALTIVRMSTTGLMECDLDLLLPSGRLGS